MVSYVLESAKLFSRELNGKLSVINFQELVLKGDGLEILPTPEKNAGYSFCKPFTTSLTS
jgi:hypothetical protein